MFTAWEKSFGRSYKVVEQNGAEDAEVVFVTMGSLGETVSTAIEELNAQGEKVRQVRIRLWRPFPEEELLEALQGAKKVIVIDRALSFGSPNGPVATEIKASLYGRDFEPEVYNFICGLGAEM